MNIVAVIIASLLLLSGIAYSRVSDRYQLKDANENVLSVETDEKSDLQNDEQEVVKTPTLTQKPTNTNTPVITEKPNPGSNINISLEKFIYSGSEVISSSTDSLFMQSQDNTASITEWYKEKISSEKMNVKSFVTTKVNDKVLNKLVGAKEGVEIEVVIEKENASSTTEIKINTVVE